MRIDPGNTAFTPLAFDRYPISHSLATSIVWGLLAASLYWALTRYRAGAVVIGLGVVSHWVLDVVTHRPDLPLYPGGVRLVGLGLWSSIPATVIVEGLMFGAGLWSYYAMTRPRDGIGRHALWALVLFLAVLYASSAGGPPPPSLRALETLALAAWMFPFWAAWIDRHRMVRQRNPDGWSR